MRAHIEHLRAMIEIWVRNPMAAHHRLLIEAERAEPKDPAAAAMLMAEGEGNPELRRNLAMRGYGDWTLDNVYAFVYETSVDLPNDVRGSFLGEIRDTNFASLLTH